MEQNGTPTPATSLFDGADWFDPIEAGFGAELVEFVGGGGQGVQGGGFAAGAERQRSLPVAGRGRCAPIVTTGWKTTVRFRTPAHGISDVRLGNRGRHLELA